MLLVRAAELTDEASYSVGAAVFINAADDSADVSSGVDRCGSLFGLTVSLAVLWFSLRTGLTLRADLTVRSGLSLRAAGSVCSS